MPDERGHFRCPANVTAVVMDRNNRARGVAAGVVSGAGCVSRQFKRRTLTRVPPVGAGEACTGQGLDPTAFGLEVQAWLGVAVARQSQRRARANGWCRAQGRTRKG